MAIGILGKALAGAAGAVKDTSLEMIRAEIMAQRDKRLHEYSVGMQRDVVQPFQREQQATEQTFKTGEGAASREHDSAKHGATLEETSRHNRATEESQRITAEAHKKSAEAKADGGEKGRLTQKDGITQVLQPRYGGKFEGGMWFPDEKNRDVGLRAMELYEQMTTGPGSLAPVAAARRASEQAEREQATGKLPIGKGAAPIDPGSFTAPGSSEKNFRSLWSK